MNKWDVVIVRYPFTDLAAIKARPAIVISPEPSGGDDAIFIAVTSNLEFSGRYDVVVHSADAEYARTGLLYPSRIKVDKIFTINKSLVARKLGSLGDALQAKVQSALRELLQLPPFQPALGGS